MAHWVRQQTLDFGSGCDIRGLRSSPAAGTVLSQVVHLGLSLPLPLSLPPLVHAFSFTQINIFEKEDSS